MPHHVFRTIYVTFASDINATFFNSTCTTNFASSFPFLLEISLTMLPKIAQRDYC